MPGIVVRRLQTHSLERDRAKAGERRSGAGRLQLTNLDHILKPAPRLKQYESVAIARIVATDSNLLRSFGIFAGRQSSRHYRPECFMDSAASTCMPRAFPGDCSRSNSIPMAMLPNSSYHSESTSSRSPCGNRILKGQGIF